MDTCSNSSKDTEEINLQRLQVVLDLDLTLVETVETGSLETGHMDSQEVVQAGCTSDIYNLSILKFITFKRPGVKRFLNELHKFADVSIFTAGTQEYADRILQDLDPDHRIVKRKYRHHCEKGKVKDISLLSHSPCRTVVIDDNPNLKGEAGSEGNTYKIPAYSHLRMEDTALYDCLSALKQMRHCPDVRKQLPLLNLNF